MDFARSASIKHPCPFPDEFKQGRRFMFLFFLFLDLEIPMDADTCPELHSKGFPLGNLF